jgi:uncharacterized protein YfaS (alpha-2-macroglobulin family)
MSARAGIVASLLLLLALTGGAQAPPSLTIQRAGPIGALTDLAQANEIRIVFSEPIVSLGRIPQPVTAPFVHIEPALGGTFRWSGTTILIFTPERGQLPHAMPYRVMVDAGVRAVSGRTLSAPYEFRFTTPTTRLLTLESHRRDLRFDRPVVMYLRFNQPVNAAAILPHLHLRLQPHEEQWERPSLTPAAEARMAALDPVGLQQFRAKVASVAAAVRASEPVPVRLATVWDTRAYPPSPDLVVVETTTVPPPESWLQLTIDRRVPSPDGPATPDAEQARTERLEHALFVTGFHCTAECDPSRWNPIELTENVLPDTIRPASSVTRVGPPDVPVARTPATPRESFNRPSSLFTLEELRYATQPPLTTYAVRLDSALVAEDGQRLGYPWVGVVENWHERAFTSFGDGHGVWESSGGTRLPFFARNVQDIREWIAPVSREALMPRLLASTNSSFRLVPPGEGRQRRLALDPDRIQAHGFDLSPALNAGGHGLVWAGIEPGMPIARALPAWGPRTREERRKSTIVQVTNLGVTVKDSPQNTLIFVTRLDNGNPVEGARVSIIRPDNRVFWQGTTSGDGIAIAPDTPLRSPNHPWQFSFIVVAEKDDDVAYVGSDWIEGVSPWEFGVRSDLGESTGLLRGTIFTDRGVYRPGEEAHFKAVLRSDAGRGIELLAPGTAVRMTLTDARAREIDVRTVRVNEWSSAEWTFTLPANGPLGTYSIEARIGEPRPLEPGQYEPYVARPRGSFLVAAYRRPDFRVDTTLTGGPDPIAGASLNAVVSGRYLFGAAMNARPVRWKTTREPVYSAPAAVLERFLPSQWTFVGHDPDDNRGEEDRRSDQVTLAANGELSVAVATDRTAGRPLRYTFEAEVEDVSRQRIANRASQVVHPAPWYIGVRKIPYFAEQKAGLQTAIVAVSPAGTVVPDVEVTVSLKQVQWNSVRRAEGGGFYAWETERRVVDAGTWAITTAADPSPLAIPLPSGGSFMVTARAEDAAGRSSKTTVSFYVLGDGYTAWTRYDHNRIDLVPENATYKPGDVARIMIQSPWERATALVTTEREGIRTHRRFSLTSTQQTVSVPITEADIPNVYVSVLLVKGRTRADGPDDGSDPGKPSFRLGYAELQVEDASKRLSVEVSANRDEYRPASSGRIGIAVKDAAGRPVTGEVTLWAVDYGVLSLTAFQTPDVLKSVYVRKALQVFTEDNRQRLVSRRALVPKGADDGGGGGEDAGAGTIRRDFRVLAFWIGSTVTDANGHATADVELPESLSTYRIMAVAGDKASRFGWGQSEVRINKPVTLRPAFPRFLAVGDRASFGSVLTNQLRSGGTASVTMKSLDPAILRIEGSDRQRLAVAAGGSSEVRFQAVARAIGDARVQMTVRLNGETDAYEEIVPVRVLSSPETVAQYGQTQTSATAALAMPAGVVPGFGGLTVELASTALVGLGEGARYLVEYPYGCAEQRASRTFALVLAADLGNAFELPGIEAKTLKGEVQSSLDQLTTFQCASGGFALWPGSCLTVSPYLTSYVLHVYSVAAGLGYRVDRTMMNRAYDYLDRKLSDLPPAGDAMRPADVAWRAFAVKVLVEGGRNEDSTINRLLPQLDRMPLFALAHLHDALGSATNRARERADLLRRIRNGILEEGGSAHVEELSDPYLMWFWNSNIRSTAIALRTMVNQGSFDLGQIQPMVRWLVQARTNGRWGNTQENAWALDALVAYYKKYESQPPRFAASVVLGRETLVRQEFSGRSTNAVTHDLPQAQLASRVPAGSNGSLRFEKAGEGMLFYTARLKYAVDALFQDALDNGFTISRTLAPWTDGKEGPPSTTFKAGELVRVTLRFSLTKERRWVAVVDPIPAGFELVESWFATTASDLARAQDDQGEREPNRYEWWWERGGFDRVERHDDRVQLFATRLSEGVHEFSYIARATTAGTYRTAPTHAEEMYEPEVFGRTQTVTIEVTR